LGRADEVRKILESSGISTVVFSDVGLILPLNSLRRQVRFIQIMFVMESWALVAEAQWDTAKAVGLRVSHAGGDERI